MSSPRQVIFGTGAIGLATAQATGARLVSMENVYMYGRPNGQPLTETRPCAAHTKKGKLLLTLIDARAGGGTGPQARTRPAEP